ncbi:uncharacterized protein LOC110850129 isoform X1 [Folsomia candida]|uniref:uncharacterized protein LOC110850129 isoform X1 n=1 Tax=Folsomia candida TaxID=158441 RepID=UPI001604CC69|nr:uncharacterized protein LOC110850129 isoform X1 [Folsomia candida]
MRTPSMCKLVKKLTKIGKPCVVVTSSGTILSVSNEAKHFKISRKHTLQEAVALCPYLTTIPKKQKFDKNDSSETNQWSFAIRPAILTFIREIITDADDEVPIPLLKELNDEYFLDLTDKVDAIIGNWETDIDTTQKVCMEANSETFRGRRLARRAKTYYNSRDTEDPEEVRLGYGLEIGQKLCEFVYQETGIVCSGIIFEVLLIIFHIGVLLILKRARCSHFLILN